MDASFGGKMRRMDKKWKHLSESGVTVAGVPSNDLDINDLPDWLDCTRFSRAQAVTEQYFTSLYFSHLCGLLMVVQLPDGLFPLLATGQSKSIPCLFRRYLSTMLHVRLWYEKNPFDLQSDAHRSIQQVRRMHSKVALKMNSEQKAGTQCCPFRGSDSSRVWVSQYDMVMTQWSFVGLLFMHPEECGLQSISRQDMEDLNYIWRVIGYLHGVQDEYNLCSGDFEETRYLSRLIFEDAFRPVLTAVPPPAPLGYEMAKDIIKSTGVFYRNASGEVFLKYWYQLFKFSPTIKLSTFRDIILYYMLVLVMGVLHRFPAIRSLLCRRFKNRLDHVSEIRDHIEKELKQRDNSVKYTTGDYTPDEFPYKDYFEVRGQLK